MTVHYRLPGVYFEVAQQPVTDNLPRMDIAGFVGFAEKGPLNIPVTIEDIKHFRDIFGGIVPLAWDNAEKRYQHSQLALAVEQFFRNGGRRCRVVRVAQELDEDHGIIGAQRQMFVVPNLYMVNGSDLEAVVVTARAVGSWADGLRVGAQLKVHSLGINKHATAENVFSVNDDDNYILLVQSTPSDLQRHDLIELHFADTGLYVYLFIDELDDYEGGKRITAQIALWFQESVVSSPAEDFTLEQLTKTDGLSAYQALMAFSPSPDMIVRRLRMDLLVWQGDAFTGHLHDLGFHSNHTRFWGKLPNDERLFDYLKNGEVDNTRFDLRAVIPEAIEPRFPLSVLPVEEPDTITVYLPKGMQTQISRYDSRGAVGDQTTPKYIRNGLERFSADIFFDSELAGSGSSSLQTEAFHKRYTLGERLTGVHALQADPTVTLLSVPDIGHRHWDNKPSPFELPMPAPVLLSLDPPDKYGRRTLKWTPVDGVRRYIIQKSNSVQFKPFEEKTVERPDRLALQELDESDKEAEAYLRFSFPEECSTAYFFRVRAEGYGRVSPWSNTLFARLPEHPFYGCEVRSAEMFTVQLDVHMPSPTEDQVLLSWQLTGEGYAPGAFDGIFELEQAHDMEFASGKIIYRRPLTERLWELQFDELAFFRVRAVLLGDYELRTMVAPDSDAEQEMIREFEKEFTSKKKECAVLIVRLMSDFEKWTIAGFSDVGEFRTVVIDECSREFSDELKKMPASKGRVIELATSSLGRTLNCSVGPWSNTEIVIPKLLSRQTVNDIIDYNDTDLLAVHCALIRLCASDADKVAVLSLPRHYLADHVARHVDRLLPCSGKAPQRLPSGHFGSGVAQVPPLNQGEARTVSYAALFHPWLYVNATESSTNENGIRASLACPADGAVCGQMAATSIQRGAWIASANNPLVDSVGLVNHFTESTLADLIIKQINMIGTLTGNPVVLHWATLSRDSDFNSLSVRRFMTLLLRLVRREGNQHVFEPNGNHLRYAVQAFWEQMLSGLYQRGALRGRGPDEAFRVVTGDEGNSRQSEALGRFYVELRVAPSRPMNFIVVRLAQTASEQLLIQEL